LKISGESLPTHLQANRIEPEHNGANVQSTAKMYGNEVPRF